MVNSNRYDAKRDANEPEIVTALEHIGATVKRHNEFDLLVGYKGRTFLMEVKNPNVDWSLTPSQKRFLNEWVGSPLYIVPNAEQAINIVRNY